MAEQGIQVSKERISGLLAQGLLEDNFRLRQEIARLLAVNEALIGRLNEHNSQQSAQANGQEIIGNGVSDMANPAIT